MLKDRYTVGNVCLVVFLAFIFSVITAIVKVEPAAAAPMDMTPTTGTGEFSNGQIKIRVQLNPVTPTNFGSLKYYIRLINDSDGSERLPTSEFVYMSASDAVYQSVYGKVLELVYTAPQGFQLAQTFNVVYSAIYYDTTLNSVYLTLRYKPPAEPQPGPAPSPGVGSAAPSTVMTDVGDLTVGATATTLSADPSQLAAAASRLAPDTPLRLPINAEHIRPTMEYNLPIRTQTDLGTRPLILPAENSSLMFSLDQVPRPTTVPAEQASLKVTISKTDPAGANIRFGEVFGTGDFVPVAPSYRLEFTWVAPSGSERVVFTSLERLFRFTLMYDPASVTDINRLAGIQRDDAGNVTVAPRTVVNPDTHTADIYIDHTSYFSVIQSTRDFSDIVSHWARNDIIAMAARDVARGMPDGTFVPDGSVTRAQFAALLVRTLGKQPDKPAAPRFSDVPAWAWYYGPVETAAKLGLVNGYEDGTFKPDARISRQEMAAMIVRAMNLTKTAPTMAQAEVDQTLAAFVDSDMIGAWARESIAKAVKTGIVQGRTITTFQPRSDATRAEGVVMLKRLLKHNGHI